MEQVRASPVKHRHEVIAHAVYALLAQVCQRFLVYLYLLIAVRAAIFYRLSDGQRLYNRPSHTVTLDVFLQVAYLLASPHLAQRHIMQGRHNALNTNLLEHTKRYLIVLTEPAPCSFHIFELLIMHYELLIMQVSLLLNFLSFQELRS